MSTTATQAQEPCFDLEKLTPFQSMLLDDLQEGGWYDVHRNQGTGGEQLPGWFYRQQTNARATINSMRDKGVLEIRRVDAGLPFFQVRVLPTSP